MNTARTGERRRPRARPLIVAAAALGVVAALTAAGMVAPTRSWGDSTPGTLLGEGGSFDQPMIDALQNSSEGVAAVAPEAPAFFQANVDQARDDFAAGQADYAISEFPLTSAQAATAAQNGRSFAYVPFASQPLAIVAEVECNDTLTFTPTTMCPNLQVSVPLLADIFGDGVSSWNDPLFAQASGGNPILTTSASANIRPLNEVDPSMVNYGLWSLFVNDPTDSGQSKKTWDSFLADFNITNDAPSELWPTNGGISGGDQQVAQTLVPVDEKTLLPPPNPEQWGLGDVAGMPMDWTGAPYNLPTIAVQNVAGAYVSPGVASMTAALQDSTMDPTTNLVTFTANPSDQAAYPIPTMSYLIVPTSGLDPAKATALAAFIHYVLGPDGQSVVDSFGAAPPTQAMITAGMAVANEVAAEGTTTTTTSATTATTSATPPTPSPTVAKATTSGGGSPGTTATNASAGSSALAFTGDPGWLLPAFGVLAVVAGEVTRRALRRRLGTRGASP